MNKSGFIGIILLGIALSISGCASMTDVVRLDSQTHAVHTLDSDILLLTETPDRPYREIAIVEVKKRGWIPLRPPASYELHPKLKLKAAQAGGEALIHVEYEQDRLRATTTAQGTVIQFTDN